MEITKEEFTNVLYELDEASPYVGVDLLKPKLDSSSLSFTNFEEIINVYRNSIGDVYDAFEKIRKDKEKLKLFIYGEIFLINELCIQVRNNKKSEEYINIIETDKHLLSLINLLKDGKLRTEAMIEDEIGINYETLITQFKKKPYYFDFIDQEKIGKTIYYCLSKTGHEYAEKIDLKNTKLVNAKETIGNKKEIIKKLISMNEESIRLLKILKKINDSEISKVS